MDKNKLKAALVAEGYNQSELAEKLSISATTLNYKINGKREFTATEISKIAKLFSLSDKDISTIFLNSKVD